MLETFLCLGLVALLSVGGWSMFSSLPAYGGTPMPPPVTQPLVAQPAPICFNHIREEAAAQTAAFEADVARGCPSDPMAYKPGSSRQVAALNAQQG
jgi:hypothetical protein